MSDDADFKFDDETEAFEGSAKSTSDRAIERKFETGRLRVVQEQNSFFLPHVVDFIEGRKWGNLRPKYQRRLRWDNRKKSKLIESFLMNVPVPPVFLYENGIGKFEVMDGQQRLNAVLEYMTNRFPLSNLEIWSELNGRTYSQLPPLVRRGLDRAKVSAITLMSDMGSEKVDSIDLRAQVFDRLNSGGVRLNQQELRNSLFGGSFNDLIVHLSGTAKFTDAWNIPAHAENVFDDGTVSDLLISNTLYKQMMDCEIVLRFFAFRQDDKYIVGSVKKILDNTMKRYRNAPDEQIAELSRSFSTTLNFVRKVLGETVFRLAPSEDNTRRLSRPLYDAEMVAFEKFLDREAEVLRAKPQIVEALEAATRPNSNDYETLVGRGNTAQTIKDRIQRVEEIINGVI
ncbi:DUF262 domain-containing protein [Maricaulis sp.]|uniref:DUF262 domain-containing protein n=1 Tax=Maricaulis sp. TaxID=1486257 RepID=UPI003A910ED0